MLRNNIQPGRPRNEAAGRAILEAARELVVKHGYDSVTTQMIAEAAGTGKQTIYRRWSSKPELILDAFLEHAKNHVDTPIDVKEPVQVALTRFLARLFTALDEMGGAIRGLMAHAQGDEAFRNLFKERLIWPRRQALREILEAGVVRGEIHHDIDLELTVAMVYGASWYRLMLDEPLDLTFAESLARRAFNVN